MDSSPPLAEPRTARPRWRKKRWRIAAGLALLFVVAELVVPRLAVRAPLATRLALPTPLYLLGQTTRSAAVPDDYVLVLGDSYAAGSGDWLLESLEAGEPHPSFHAGHVAHRLTGRELVNFGNAGVGSVGATAYLVSKRFAQLWRSGLGEPSEIVLLFYEGNDLDDDLNLAHKHLDLASRAPDSFRDEELDALLAKRASTGVRRGLPGSLYAPYVLQKLLKDGLRGEVSAAGTAAEPELVPLAAGEAGPDGATAFEIGDARFAFTVPVQGPAPELDEAEEELTLRLVQRSLLWLEERFPGRPKTLLYVPSPPACYELASPEVRIRSYRGRTEAVPSAAVAERSDRLRHRVAELAASCGLRVVDATEALRAAAAGGPIHGPRDANHLNRRGYEALGVVLAAALREPAED